MRCRAGTKRCCPNTSRRRRSPGTCPAIRSADRGRATARERVTRHAYGMSVVLQRRRLSSRPIEGPAYEIRGALPEDEDQIVEIARHLNTVNLPDERAGVKQILD